MNQDSELERKAFEDWYKEKYPDQTLQLDNNGNYACGAAPIRFVGFKAGWQARAAIKPEQCNDLVERVARAIHSQLLGRGDDWEDAYTSDKYPNVKIIFMTMAKAAIAAMPKDKEAERYKAALETIKTKLDTSNPNSQSAIMLAWDKAKSHILTMPGASLPREIFESVIEEINEEIEAALEKGN